MPEELTPEEVALLIRGKKILNAKGVPRNIAVSGICEQAGVSHPQLIMHFLMGKRRL